MRNISSDLALHKARSSLACRIVHPNLVAGAGVDGVYDQMIALCVTRPFNNACTPSSEPICCGSTCLPL